MSPTTSSSTPPSGGPPTTSSSGSATPSSGGPATTLSSGSTTPSSGGPATSSRREVVAAAAVALLARPASAAAQRSDIAVLIKLVAREEAAAEAYGGAAGQLLPRIYNDELDHAAALRTHLDALGRRPAPRGLDAPARRLVRADDDQRSAAAIALEASLVRDYAVALEDIADPSVLQTAATILASHAQHLARMRAGAVA
jgi:Ferritin-like domain